MQKWRDQGEVAREQVVDIGYKDLPKTGTTEDDGREVGIRGE